MSNNVTDNFTGPLYMLDREPTRWKCYSCGHVNRALTPVCVGCTHQRWEQLGFTLQETIKFAQFIYGLHKGKDEPQ